MQQKQEPQQDLSRPPLGRKILDAIKAQNGNWISRADIAKAIGRPDDKIRANDVKHINQLVEAGLIEMQTVTIGAAQTKFEYRYIAQK